MLRLRSCSRTAALVLGSSALLLGGCGEDEVDAQPYVDALSESLQDAEEGEFAIDDDIADCIAERSVEILGAGRLDEAGIDPDDLADSDDVSELDLDIEEDDARALAETFVDCEVPFGEGLATSFGDPSLADCFDENFDADAFVEAQTLRNLGEDDDADEAFNELTLDLFDACGVDV